MRPRICMERGWWRCGLLDEHPINWSWAMSPSEAYRLWKRSRSK